MRNLWSSLKSRFFRLEEEKPPTDWDSRNLEKLFNEVCDAKEAEISEALAKRNAAVVKFLKEERKKFEIAQDVKKTLFFCDVTKIPR
jgi:type I site-specific restriction endonuclease